MKTQQQDHRIISVLSQESYLPIWLEAFLVDRKAAHLAKSTVGYYKEKLTSFANYCETQAITQIDQITPQTIRDYLLALSETGHNTGGVHAAYRCLRAFLNWWENETEPPDWRNPMKKVKPPKMEVEPLEPVDMEVIRALLDTCKGGGFTAIRDRAIILTLMDTGARASEICAMDKDDIEPVQGEIIIKKSKSKKFRSVYIGKRTRQSMRAYIRTRTDSSPALFVTDEGERLTYHGLRQIIRRRANRAGIKEPSLHSFRRFFGLQFLRNGGDVFTLQKLMGHADLQILRRYLKQTDNDMRNGHRQYGPVDNVDF